MNWKATKSKKVSNSSLETQKSHYFLLTLSITVWLIATTNYLLETETNSKNMALGFYEIIQEHNFNTC